MTPAGTAAFRCSLASQALAEPVAGTASTVHAFVLVECPGPWGVQAVQDCRLPDPVKDRLAELESRHRVRPLLIRRPGRAVGQALRIFATYVDRRTPWVETTVLENPHDLLDLDLTGLADGRSPGLAPHEAPLFLVCTHGRHDACCAERGRPLAAALALEAPEETWEVSHIGGDRFAGNALVLPQGLYYGRLGPLDAPGFAARHRRGELDLDHLRGRSSYPFAVQVAEVHLRRHLDHHRAAPLDLERAERAGAATSATFRLDGSRWRVTVETGKQPARQLTCRSTGENAASVFSLMEIVRV